ncbi:hypothetical protein OPV22_017466 [Ensete ventricosum]|uniref:DUF659 domain-containing protein n=1 Tax=Ensete ventricosum TaxID=4639 RepID=A0AAV8QT94_ENSVE|nr:hypothetical protein OPV22_017466 [Ensete ventricosum]
MAGLVPHRREGRARLRRRRLLPPGGGATSDAVKGLPPLSEEQRQALTHTEVKAIATRQALSPPPSSGALPTKKEAEGSTSESMSAIGDVVSIPCSGPAGIRDSAINLPQFNHDPTTVKPPKAGLQRCATSPLMSHRLRLVQVAQGTHKFFFEAGLDTANVKLPSCQGMMDAVIGCGSGYKVPTYDESKGTILHEEVKEVLEHVEDVKQSWGLTGCSILLDGWTDPRGRILVNFLVNCPLGTIFLRSVDAYDAVDDVDTLFLLICNVIEEVGVKYVLQVVAHDTSDCIEAAGKKIMEKYRYLASKVKGKSISKLVKESSFWVAAVDVLKITNPLLDILHQISGTDRSPMGFSYDSIDRVKEKIKRNLGHEEARYDPIWTLVDDIWDNYLHSPLHSAGHFLNPSLFYSSDFYIDAEVTNGILYCIVKMTMDQQDQELIVLQLDEYREAKGVFSGDAAVDQRSKISPGK